MATAADMAVRIVSSGILEKLNEQAGGLIKDDMVGRFPDGANHMLIPTAIDGDTVTCDAIVNLKRARSPKRFSFLVNLLVWQVLEAATNG